jgi:glycosyltransferase involved in cell wall biosynthesis
VQKRIEKYYQTKSIVVYPPVKLAKNNFKSNKSVAKNYLFFSRLVKQKGIELVIQAFNKNQKPLLVVGTSNQAKKWQKMANKNIKFLGFLTDKEIPKIYKKSKALVYAAIDEDFGMIPVEAMSYGIPVIAYRDGGIKESVIEEKTGLFFNSYDLNSLNQTVSKFEKMSFSRQACVNQAKKFGEEKFKKQILQAILSLN